MNIFNRTLDKFRFVHSADIHIDGSLSISSLEQMSEEARAIVTGASRKTFCNLIDLCLSNEVDFLVISGDLFEFAKRSLNAQMFVREQLCRLHQKNIMVYIVAGNHDHLGAEYADIEWPANVVWFKGNSVREERFVKNDIELARICGISFLKSAETTNLSLQFRDISQASLFTIGMLHTNLQGTSGHSNYAPCVKGDLESSMVDYFALGHVHNKAIVKKQNPAIIYPGNSQGRGFYEKGEKGCYLLDISGNVITKMQFIPVDSVRFEELDVEVFVEMSLDELMDNTEKALKNIDDDKLDMIILKLSFKGSYSFDSNYLDDILFELRKRAQRNFGKRVWIDNIVNKAIYKTEEIPFSNGFIEAFVKKLDEAEKDGDMLRGALEPIYTNGDLQRFFDGFTESDISEILSRAKSLGIELLGT